MPLPELVPDMSPGKEDSLLWANSLNIAGRHYFCRECAEHEIECAREELAELGMREEFTQ